jgi:hypothetical protein
VDLSFFFYLEKSEHFKPVCPFAGCPVCRCELESEENEKQETGTRRGWNEMKQSNSDPFSQINCEKYSLPH